MKQIPYDKVYQDFKKSNLKLETPQQDYRGIKQKLIVTDGVYRTLIKYENFRTTNRVSCWFCKDNPYIIDNINKYLEINKHGNFKCLSSQYVDRNSPLEFCCTRCGKRIALSWFNASRELNHKNHYGISCDNCDGRTESIHATVLKQIFQHEYPDTILEERSCVNPNTNAVMATDIVNHRLKIAIEIQGQFHEWEDQKKRDRIKKNFWVKKGYTFYDFAIEGTSVLEYVQLFFPTIKAIPEYIDYTFSKKLNIFEVQKLLDSGLEVTEIAQNLGIAVHRIYDAIYSKKLSYPEQYHPASLTAVVQLDLSGELLNEYPSMVEAEKQLGLTKGLIASCIHAKTYYSSGYLWFTKAQYAKPDFKIPNNCLNKKKFNVPVNKYDLEGKLVACYSCLQDAAKDSSTTAYKIYEVTINKRKTIKGYTYKID